MTKNAPSIRRVLMTGDALGGVWTYSLELANALSSFGVDVLLAIMGGPLSSHQRREAAAIQSLVVEESAFKLEWMEEPWADIREAGSWLLELEEEFQPDLIHLNGYVHGALPWKAPVVVVGHSCVASWWTAVKGEAPPPQWDRYQSEVCKGIWASDMVIVPTRAMLSTLHSLYGSFPRSKVIPNGRDPNCFPPVTSNEKEPLVLSAGRLWDEAKNVRALQRVADNLAWPVYVAGDDQHPAGTVVQLQGLNFLGRLPTSAVAEWFRRASIFASPARYEPFGLSILEAGLAGCGLVLGDIASLRENWDGAAWFVGPDDSNALKEGLQALITDRDLRDALSARARARALEFTPLRMVQGYLETYEELISERRAACAAV